MDQIKQGCVYLVPNTVVVTYGEVGLAPTYAFEIAKRRDKILKELQSKGLFVQPDEMTKAIPSHGTGSAGDIAAQLMWPIAVWVHGGHGDGSGAIMVWDDYAKATSAVTEKAFPVYYRLTSVYLISCSAAKNAAKWKGKLVAPGGVLYGWETDIVPGSKIDPTPY